MDAQSLVAGLTVGGALGAMAGYVRSRSLDRSLLISARSSAQFWEAKAKEWGREVAELRAWKMDILAPLKAGNAARHAKAEARKAKTKALHTSMQADIDAANAILDRRNAA